VRRVRWTRERHSRTSSRSRPGVARTPSSAGF
jgi:hypothetical protein